MKKLAISVVLVTVLALFTSACESNAITRYDCNMKKYVTLPEETFEGAENSKDFEKYYSEFLAEKVENNGILTRKYDATVEKDSAVGVTLKSDFQQEESEFTAGDITFKYGEMANEVIGKKTGESFVYNFENIDGNITKFSVTIDYVAVPEFNDISASAMGYESLEEAEKAIKSEAKEAFTLKWLTDNSKINDYPEQEYTELYEARLNYYKQLASGYGLSVEEYYKQEGFSKKAFEKKLDKQIKEIMNSEMPVYAYARAKKMKLTQENIDNITKEIAKKSGAKPEAVLEQTPLRDLELSAVTKAVLKEIKAESKK